MYACAKYEALGKIEGERLLASRNSLFANHIFPVLAPLRISACSRTLDVDRKLAGDPYKKTERDKFLHEFFTLQSTVSLSRGCRYNPRFIVRTAQGGVRPELCDLKRTKASAFSALLHDDIEATIGNFESVEHRAT